MWIRLKLMAPFHRPRDPRLRRPPSAPPLPAPFLRLAMTALRLDHRRLARHGRPADLLAQGGTYLPSRRGAECDPLPGGQRLVDGFDDADVDQAFLARRFRCLARAYAAGEVDQLRRELVALGEFLPLLLPVQRALVAQALGIFIGRIHHHAAARAHNFVARAVGRAEAAGESRDPLTRKI